MTETKNKFATPGDVLKIVTSIEDSMLARSSDRAMIDGQFNGSRPFTPQEEKEHQIQVNANFLEGYKIAQAGILQINSALLYKDRFFNARCLRGKSTKRREYAEKLTNNLHRPLKRKRSGKRFLYTMQNRNCALTLHGVGALWWSNNHAWMPKFVPLDDLLIPTDTPLEMSDGLGYFGVNSWLTPYQFWQMTQQEKSVGWNKEMAREILKSLQGIDSYGPDYWEKPEKMEQLWKQRSAYLNSDAVPKVKITTFYNQDDEGKWYRKVIIRDNAAVGIESPGDRFLYESDKPFADSIDQILHIQFGDGSVVAPFKYKAVRGLGVLLYSLIELMNRLRCQFTQSVFTDLLPILRIDNPVDRDRPRMLQMQAYGVMDQGVRFVPKEERHQPNHNLVTSAMSEFRQLMSENSASYVQDIDTGSQKEMTLGEAQIRLQAVNKMVASMLMGAYEQEVFFYEETLRRFMSKTSSDPEVKEFQERCRADGIPDSLMVADAWQLDITRAFGAGDQTLAQQEVTSLMGIQQQLDPQAQRIVRRQYVATMTRNPDLAAELVPEQPEQVTSGRKAAEDVFGTLMIGVEVGLREGIEQQDYVAAMLSMMSSVIQRIQQTDNMGTMTEVIGLNTVANDAQQHIELLSKDPNEKEFVTAAQKELGKMMNEVKGFQQRLMEQQPQQDPKAEAEAAALMAKAQQDAQIKQQQFEQQQVQSQAKFQAQMQQMMEKHALQMEQLTQSLNLDRLAELMKTKTETDATKAKAASEVAAIQIKTSAEVSAIDKKATAEANKPKPKPEPANKD
jgi:hypothetical protein